MLKSCLFIIKIKSNFRGHMVNCKQCGILTENKSFCSINCANEFKRRNLIIKTCLECNKEFSTNKINQRFCSSKCYGRYNSKNPGVLQIRKEKDRYKKFCRNCNKEFETHYFRIKTNNFCSTNCHHNFRRETIICQTCGVEFVAPKHQKKVYCSTLCHRILRGNTSKAENEIKDFLKENNFIHELKPIIYKENLFVPDFCFGNKIIEYYGDYWHCHSSMFEANDLNKSINLTAKEKWDKDDKRIKIFNELGYETLIIWEHEYNLSKSDVLLKCLNFIKGI